ncbi:MAG: Sec-independent protein translocase protein TatB [Helicobacteraceae bacterium]|jgi:sec-independent protein translocase protein TatB|nr:Sec-independent protein translocase protein TatB [Helicobacteraceae bacterium]
MFGMGLGELLLVAVVAIIFLGPEKLPEAMVKTAKFFRAVKKHLTEAKTAFDQEINLSELKSDALEYKEKLAKEASSAVDKPKLDETSREVRDLFSDLSSTVKKTENEIKNA